MSVRSSRLRLSSRLRSGAIPHVNCAEGGSDSESSATCASVPVPSIAASLRVTQGPYTGQEFQVVVHQHQTSRVCIGRASTRWVRKHGVSMPGDDELSSTHAQLVYGAGGRLLFFDDSSTNGSAVDGREVEEHVRVELTTGSTLRLGQATITVTIHEDVQADEENKPQQMNRRTKTKTRAGKDATTKRTRGDTLRDQLLQMGYDSARAGAALANGCSDIEGAIEWLELNQEQGEGESTDADASAGARRSRREPSCRAGDDDGVQSSTSPALRQTLPPKPPTMRKRLAMEKAVGAKPTNESLPRHQEALAPKPPTTARGAAVEPTGSDETQSQGAPASTPAAPEDEVRRPQQQGTEHLVAVAVAKKASKAALAGEQTSGTAPHTDGVEVQQERQKTECSAPLPADGTFPHAITPMVNQGIKGPSKVLLSKYMQARKRGVSQRKFNLKSIREHECVPTGRTIKRMRGWEETWPALREFMQNTIDHLELLDQKTGRLHAALELTSFPDNVPQARYDDGDAPLPLFEFHCGSTLVCRIRAARNVLEIEQHFTFPLAPRALDTGVPDTTKMNSSSAGGFGDGFKTAAVALLARKRDGNFDRLEWAFESGGQRIDWKFHGQERKAVGTFAACDVLNVDITRQDANAHRLGENVMLQTIVGDRIGVDFVFECVPRLQVFWQLDEASLIGNTREFLCDATAQRPIFDGPDMKHPIVVEPGVYICGIYVRPTRIKGCVMAFFGNTLEVSGRDRNEVSETRLVEECAEVLRTHQDHEGLAVLLSSLKGMGNDSVEGLLCLTRKKLQQLAKENGIPANIASKSIAERLAQTGLDGAGKKRVEGESDAPGPSWLTRDHKNMPFLDRILHLIKEHVLYTVFNFTRKCIFVSSRMTKTGDPFTKWACTFLKSHGAPVVTLALGANKTLFDEVPLPELRDRCAQLLSVQAPLPHAQHLMTTMEKVIQFMRPKRRIKVVVCENMCQTPFLHEDSWTFFVRDFPVTCRTVQGLKNALVRYAHYFGDTVQADSDALTEAFVALKHKQELSPADIDSAIAEAKKFKASNAAFEAESVSDVQRKTAMKMAKEFGSSVYVDGMPTRLSGVYTLMVDTWRDRPVYSAQATTFKRKGQDEYSAQPMLCYAKGHWILTNDHYLRRAETKGSNCMPTHYANAQSKALIPSDAEHWLVYDSGMSSFRCAPGVKVRQCTAREMDAAVGRAEAAREQADEQGAPAKAKTNTKTEPDDNASDFPPDMHEHDLLQAERERAAALEKQCAALQAQLKRNDASATERAEDPTQPPTGGSDKCCGGGDNHGNSHRCAGAGEHGAPRAAYARDSTTLAQKIESCATGDRFARDTVPSDHFARDGSEGCGHDECGMRHAELHSVPVPPAMGARGSWFVDEQSATEISEGAWCAERLQRLSELRQQLNLALTMVQRAFPVAAKLLRCVNMGFDATCRAGQYFGFCQGDGALIIINMYAFMDGQAHSEPGDATLGILPDSVSPDLLNLLGTLTHEIAHAIERATSGMGHGPNWRHTHMALLKQVLRPFVRIEIVDSSTGDAQDSLQLQLRPEHFV